MVESGGVESSEVEVVGSEKWWGFRVAFAGVNIFSVGEHSL
jgi:hypothetical protein